MIFQVKTGEIDKPSLRQYCKILISPAGVKTWCKQVRCTCGRRVCGEGGGCRGEIIRHRYVAESEKNEKPVAAPVIPALRLPELRNRLALQSGLCDRLSRLRSLQHGRTFVIYAGQVTGQRSNQLSRCPARGAGTCDQRAAARCSPARRGVWNNRCETRAEM